MSDLEPPERYVLAFEGSGGAAGFAKGDAHVLLVAEGEATRLDYRATAQIGGKLAQVGSRLVDGVAKRMAEEFFTRFNARFAPVAPAGEPQAPAIEGNAPTGPDATPADTSGAAPGSRMRWTIAAVVLLVVLFAIGYTLRR